MTLATGSRLGPYEITGAIGAGGMGEVYRARDAKLQRDVAIKVLPESLSRDAEALARFEREARAVAALSHPNILAIFDFGSHEGTAFAAMELLEGETLRARLAGGALTQRRAVEYAVQIASGLAAAHEKAIVHRDLKPENVFVTKDGRVKILDFGLAKRWKSDSALDGTSAPTAAHDTDPGTVMGTAGYMSPEQVKGKPADARSDIFSFGAILYEMLSGRRAFHGDSGAETMSAILKEEPPDLTATNRNISPGLERIVRHCVEKDPEQRFHSAHDLAFDLEALSGLSTPRLEPPPSGRSRFLPSPSGAVALATALLVGALAGRFVWKTTPPPPPSFTRLTYGRGPIWSARFAPDGQTIVYSASWDGAQRPQLYSVRAESPESQRLALPSGRIEAISGKGEMLMLDVLQFSTGYARMGTLSQAPLSGSAPRDLLVNVGNADWSPDGSAMAVVRAPEWRYRLEFPTGRTLYETTGWISYPRVSPSGDAVAFLDHGLFGDDRGSVAIVDLSGGKKTLSTGWESVQGVAWAPAGDEVWFTARKTGNARALYAVTRAGRERTVGTTPSGMTLQDIARDGRVLFVESNARLGFLGQLPGETKERDLSGLDWSYGAILSADGKTVVFTEQGVAGGPGYSVYLRRMDGSAPIRLGEGGALALSPDGKWVLAYLVRTSPIQLVMLPTGAGDARTFPKDGIEHEGGVFLPDGKRILFNGHEPGRPSRAFLQDLAGGAAKPVTSEGVLASLLSPDGATLVTGTHDQQTSLTPLLGGPSRPIPGLEGHRALGFSADGRSLFVRPVSRELVARVFRLDLTTGRRELWRELTPGDPAGLTQLTPASISADGKVVIFMFGRTLSDLYLADGLH